LTVDHSELPETTITWSLKGEDKF